MFDEVELRVAASGSEDWALVAEMAEYMRMAITPLMERVEDPRHFLALAMTAGVMFGGTHYGMLIAMGDMPDNKRQLRKSLEMVSRNFKSGIDVGIRKATRLRDQKFPTN